MFSLYLNFISIKLLVSFHCNTLLVPISMMILLLNQLVLQILFFIDFPWIRFLQPSFSISVWNSGLIAMIYPEMIIQLWLKLILSDPSSHLHFPLSSLLLYKKNTANDFLKGKRASRRWWCFSLLFFFTLVQLANKILVFILSLLRKDFLRRNY